MKNQVKRIIVIGTRGFPYVQGGIETHCEKLYHRIVAQGYDVFVFGRYPYIQRKPFLYRGVHLIPLKCPKAKAIETILYSMTAVFTSARMRPDIVHFHGIGPSFFVALAKRMGFKVVATHHGFDYEREKWGAFAKFILRLGEKQLCEADAVISVSKNIHDSISVRNGCKFTIIPNGVDLPIIRQFGEFCRKWGVQSRKYFIFVGRLVPEKCIHVLLDAFNMFQSDWKLVIAGEADHKSSYSIKLKERLSGNPSVVMTGFVKGDELAELFSNAGCFVLPSSIEGLPIALLEALSYGLRCIVSEIPAHRDICHENIQYFQKGKSTVLSYLMKEHCLKAPVSKTEIKKARDFIYINYNFDIIAQKTIDVYRSIL